MAQRKCKLVFAVMSDGHKVDERGKIDLHGIFTSMGIWAAPASRECSLTIWLTDVPKGKTNITIWARRPGKKAVLLGGQVLECPKRTLSAMQAIRFPLRLTATGDLEVGAAVGKRLTGHNAVWMPLHVSILDWPTLPKGKALKRVLENPASVKSARASLQCNTCDSNYIFQIGLDPSAELPDEAMPFPEDGVFICQKCSQRHELKDVEGQLRSQLGRNKED